jgi:sterol desaturase/sphingolipid hydroxylase (fatty acid hydroxylase superfamily)
MFPRVGLPIHLIALGLILLEALLLWQLRRKPYHWQASLASLGLAFGHVLSRSLVTSMTIGLFEFAWSHRLWTMPIQQWWAILLLFLSAEFCYYWYHRAAHEVWWLWATHAVHHSAEHLNLSAAYRLGWTGLLSGNFLFFLPLCWLGFSPLSVTVAMALSLVYQFWIHTELIPKLGPLEWVLNTPSHHRVHHATNQEYLDQNYGGVLIIFDRLFGTFRAEQALNPPVYGLTHSLNTHNPIIIALQEWRRLWRAIKRAKTWRQSWRVALGPPG